MPSVCSGSELAEELEELEELDEEELDELAELEAGELLGWLDNKTDFFSARV